MMTSYFWNIILVAKFSARLCCYLNPETDIGENVLYPCYENLMLKLKLLLTSPTRRRSEHSKQGLTGYTEAMPRRRQFISNFSYNSTLEHFYTHHYMTTICGYV